MKPLLSKIFYALIGVFFVIICMFFVPPVQELAQGPFLFLSPFVVFSLLGAALLFLTTKSKTKGRSRKFLILTGVSATGLFIGILLHNLLYALAIVSAQIIILKYLFEFLHATFFIIGVIVCPLGFAIGAISTIVILIKKRK